MSLGFKWLIQTCHAVPMPCWAVALRSLSQSGMFGAWQWHGMVYVNQTQLHCVNQMGKIQFKPLAIRHGMCELAFTLPPGQGTESGSEMEYLPQIRVLFSKWANFKLRSVQGRIKLFGGPRQ